MTNANKTVDVAALELLCDKLECGDANHRATAAQIRKSMNGAKPQLPEGIEWPRDKNGDFIDLRVMYTHGYGALERVTFFPTPEGIKSFVMSHDGMYVECDKCEPCQPEVLDADGVPIKAGDTVYAPGYFEAALKVERFDAAMKMVVVFSEETLSCGFRGDQLTHRKPDTQEAIDRDAAKRPCQYFGTQKCSECSQGNADGSDIDYDECCIAQIRDLLNRQRKLMGGE